MKKEVGVWIDHRQAVIVIGLDGEEAIKQVASNLGKHIRFSGASLASGEHDLHNDATEDGRDRRMRDELNRYYDEVIATFRDATSVLIMGPGEAKVELQKRFESHNTGGAGVTLKSADKMTEPQIAAEVRQFFREVQHG